MKDKSKVIFIIAILAITALIAYVCYGILKGSKNPVATMEVSYVDSEGNEQTGTIKLKLNPDVAPTSVANFIQLANNGFYDGLTFHRIISDFMIQGGDKKGDGSGSAKLSDLDKKIQADSAQDYTYSIKGEFAANGINNSLKFEKGVIGMARSDYSTYGFTQEGYNSASSQFFIVTTDNKDTLNSLNQSYASFGKVVEGYDVVEAIANVKLKESETEEESSTPEKAPVIKSIRVETYGANYGIPKTINYDEILSKVQTYQNYYNQLMSSYSGSDTSAEGEITDDITTDGTSETSTDDTAVQE